MGQIRCTPEQRLWAPEQMRPPLNFTVVELASPDIRQQIHSLQEALERKNHALEEAAALLALRKKQTRSGARARTSDQRPRS